MPGGVECGGGLGSAAVEGGVLEGEELDGDVEGGAVVFGAGGAEDECAAGAGEDGALHLAEDVELVFDEDGHAVLRVPGVGVESGLQPGQK